LTHGTDVEGFLVGIVSHDLEGCRTCTVCTNKG
jgi:hypothetical protein